MGQHKPEGSVMVVGGGIAGIQASLSLSGAGYGVYLVEHQDQLGGMIPRLHRLYPLCACCKLDPRISACEQDPNISVLLKTAVKKISGDLGDFTISLDQDGEPLELEIGAIVLAGGIETFDPSKYETYSYGKLPNVLTSVEFEQLQKPLGPQKGELKRPSDGKSIQKIGWLQCVGSRDINRCDAPYCSSVCCMYALKEALSVKDVDEDVETTIFYMDMRTPGKGFEDYLNQALLRDVRLVRSRVHTVDCTSESDDPVITYADEKGHPLDEGFDLVVLSVGLRPSSEAVTLANSLGLDMGEDQFLQTEAFNPVATKLPGVFVCGGIGGLYDVSQSITQAAASVSEISAVLAPRPLSPPNSLPRVSADQETEPKILVAYSLCPGMEPGTGAEIEKSAKEMPLVKAVAKADGDIRGEITRELQETGANRVVFACCTPIVHKGALEDALRQAGLNPYLYETVDLRAVDPDSASVQLRDRLRMGVSRASLISPPVLKEIPVVKHALVVGGGVSGLESARALSKEGFPVTLVEKQEQLGGHGRHVRSTWQGYDAQEHLRSLIDSVEKDSNISVRTGTQVKENRGFAGNFVAVLEKNGEQEEVAHGAAILAPGGEPVEPGEYQYGKNKNVYLWSQLSNTLIEDPQKIQGAGSVVFIQCVGSREPQIPHCSNFCCTFAVRTAVDLKDKNPDTEIYILYREMRTVGERERLYREAREKGVIFIRYDLDNKPFVESSGKEGRLKVTVMDPVLDNYLAINADIISLQTAILGSNNRELADIFGINLDSNGFFAESPEKMKPVDSTGEGIYIAGLASYPKDTEESIAQAKAASARAMELLCKESVTVGGPVAEVLPEKCAVCCTCVRTCPFNVPYIDPDRGAAFIDPGLCQGCGMCVAECPGKAIVMSTCSDEMLNEAPHVLLYQ